MGKNNSWNTAERVSTEVINNYVVQRSLLAYAEAGKRVSRRVLEIGSGTGYGIKCISPNVETFVTVDKHKLDSDALDQYDNVEFVQCNVPPLDQFEDNSFDYVISFQVIEHIKDDIYFIEEVSRVLKPGGFFIVSTPNSRMTLTRNPWHIREYTPKELYLLLSSVFNVVEEAGITGNKKVMDYYYRNKKSVQRFKRFDIFNLEHNLPAALFRLPYDFLNNINRKKLLRESDLVEGFSIIDFYLSHPDDDCLDLFYVAQKK